MVEGIPWPAAAGRPVDVDADRYRGRNVVERGFNRINDSRGSATGYDKHVLIHRGGVVLASVLLWLTSQETRARGRKSVGNPRCKGLPARRRPRRVAVW